MSRTDMGGIPGWAHYREATQNGVSCSTCDYFVAGRCEMFNYAPVNSDYVCDRWEGKVEKDDPALAPMYTGVPPSGNESQDESSLSLIDLIGALEPTMKMNPGFVEKVSGKVGKGQARPAEVNLRVNGMSRLPDGGLTYRMVTRDGHYVGRTNSTKIRARKGDVLKVQANDFLQSANGDLRWDNPNVVSHFSDAPHSWLELCAMAGGNLEKDGGAGTAGDIPPAGDMGSSSSMPSGPTLDAVHIPAPLPNISIAYAPKKRLKYQVQKTDRHHQLIYGVVLEPEVLDSQDDFMLPKQVERAAHTYLKKVARGNASVSKIQHRTKGFFKEKPSVVPVESFIAPVDFSYDGKEMVKKGTWVMVLHIEDSNIWNDVLDGKYTGLSIGGTGIRRELRVPELEGTSGLSHTEPADWFS